LLGGIWDINEESKRGCFALLYGLPGLFCLGIAIWDIKLLIKKVIERK
jgi:hypothetical protein